MYEYDRGYNRGYFQALMDLTNCTRNYEDNIKGLKYKKYSFLLSLIKYLALNKLERDLFIRYGGDVAIMIDAKSCEVIKIWDKYSVRCPTRSN